MINFRQGFLCHLLLWDHSNFYPVSYYKFHYSSVFSLDSKSNSLLFSFLILVSKNSFLYNK